MIAPERFGSTSKRRKSLTQINLSRRRTGMLGLSAA
jgi:hypothetical protein